MVSRQFFRFLVTGGIAAAANIGSRYVFSLFMGFELAVVFAYLVGMAIAYVLARLFVFEASGRSVRSEFGRFALVNLFALAFVWAISVGLAFVVFPAIHFTWHPEDVAHFIGVLAPAATSFLGHRHFSFRKDGVGGTPFGQYLRSMMQTLSGSQQLKNAISVIVVVSIAAIIIPWQPFMPGGKLDDSWMLGMNTAAREQMAFGSQIIFTFGPFAALYTKLYDPSLFQEVVILSSFFTTSVILTNFYFRNYNILLQLIIIFILSQIYVMDAIFLFYPFAFFYSTSLYLKLEGRYKRYANVAILLSTVPLAMLPLIKGTFLISSVGFLVPTIVLAVLLRKPALAAGIFFVFVLALTGFWLTSGQHLADFPSYLGSMRAIVSGYSEAMASFGPPVQVVLYLAAALFLLLAVGYEFEWSLTRPIFWINIYAVALYFFISFKSGFVRHDGHAMIAADALLLAAIPLYDMLGRLRRKRPVEFGAAMAYAMATAFVIQGSYVGYSPQTAFNHACDNFSRMAAGLEAYITGGANLNAQYDQVLARIRRENPIPHLSGSADIYDLDQAALIASGNIWNPRPILQSYSAYDPTLAEANRRHLIGLSSPDNVIFALQPIDGRVPSLADGASWPELMGRYRLTGFDGTYAYLKKRQEGHRTLGRQVMPAQPMSLGVPIAVPQTSAIVFAKIDVEATVFGNIVEKLFKIPPLYMNFLMNDGTIEKYRTISGMMKSGFLISPLAKTTTDFALIMSGSQDALSAARVRSILIQTPYPWLHLWSERMTISFETFSPSSEALPSTLRSPAVELDSAKLLDEATCNGVIDTVNGTILNGRQKLPLGHLITISGWLASTTDERGYPGSVLLRVRYGDGTDAYFKATRTERPDVNSFLHKADMPPAGFSALLDLKQSGSVKGVDVVGGYKYGDVLCKNLFLEKDNK